MPRVRIRAFILPIAIAGVAALAGPADGAVRATTLTTANLRPTPTGGKAIMRLRPGTRVTALCTTVGSRARVPRDGLSRLWVRVVVKGRKGWIADGLINRDRHMLLAPICGVPQPSGPAPAGVERGHCAIRPVVSLIPPYASRDEFIAAALPGAVASRAQNRVPVSVTLAQAMLESDGGRIAALGNNFFGIKAKAPDRPRTYRWGANAVGCTYKKTSEGERDGKLVRTYDAFRAYATLDASIMDHGALLTSNPVYAPAFAFTDRPRRFTVEIGRFYATDNRYARKVFDIMDRYGLLRYDGAPPA